MSSVEKKIERTIPEDARISQVNGLMFDWRNHIGNMLVEERCQIKPISEIITNLVEVNRNGHWASDVFWTRDNEIND